MCEQGYYEDDLSSFVQGVTSNDELALFEGFLDPRRSYDLDSSRNFSSNHYVPVWTEVIVNGLVVERMMSLLTNSTQYLSGNKTQFQGGYECSIRSVTEWEDYRSGFLLDHPNYYSRYMDKKAEGDGNIYSYWKDMKFPPTHHKTDKLVSYDYEYLGEGITFDLSFLYTDVGYMKDGVWQSTGTHWEKGICIVEFERHCNDDDDGISTILVQDTDAVSMKKVAADAFRDIYFFVF